jgi:hypothetical protein
MKELINNFLTQFCVKTSENEDPATTELYMDNHYYIEYENQGYYIPEDNSSYTDDDEMLIDFLVYYYGND